MLTRGSGFLWREISGHIESLRHDILKKLQDGKLYQVHVHVQWERERNSVPLLFLFPKVLTWGCVPQNLHWLFLCLFSWAIYLPKKIIIRSIDGMVSWVKYIPDVWLERATWLWENWKRIHDDFASSIMLVNYSIHVLNFTNIL